MRGRRELALILAGLWAWHGAAHAASDPLAPGRLYWIVAADSGLCLRGGGLSGRLVQSACLADPYTQWTPAGNGNGSVSLQSKANGLCVDVLLGAQASGAPLVTFNCSGAANQAWWPRQLGDGYQLVGAQSGKCLAVEGGQLHDGQPVNQADCAAGGGGQRFYFKEVVTDPAKVGQWGPAIPLTTVPVAAAALPNGKILYWSSWDRYDFILGMGERNKTYTGIFDPATQGATEYLVTNTQHDMFCPGTAMLADGRVHVAGGGPSVSTTSIYDFRANAWARDADMHETRWYNTSVFLPDGGVLTLGGNIHTVPTTSGVGEIWHQGQGWRVVPNLVMGPLASDSVATLGGARAQEYPKMNVAPDGRLLVSGATPNMQWYDPAGNGKITPAGVRHGDAFAELASTVQFSDHLLLKAGGNMINDGPGADTSRSSTSVYVIDMRTGQATAAEGLGFPRAFSNGVVLPDGKVAIFGGLNNGKNFSDDGSIMHPELFDPASGRWRLLAPAGVPRNYHSVALLMPDARVFSGGGGLCGMRCPIYYNHPDAQIYSPPYLFRGARPVIAAAPAEIGYGQAFAMRASAGVVRASFIRMSSVTHSVNTDQRFLELPLRAQEDGSYILQSPANANLAPPGYYMLFALDAQDVPSVAKIVLLKSPAVALAAAPAAAAAASRMADGIDTRRGYLIAGAESGGCLAFAATGQGDRATLAGQACAEGAVSRFQFEPAYPGYYRIRSQQSGLCLAAETGDGAPVLPAICRREDLAQQWHPVRRAGGGYGFVDRRSRQFLELGDCASASARHSLRQGRDGGACQDFRLQ